MLVRCASINIYVRVCLPLDSYAYVYGCAKGSDSTWARYWTWAGRAIFLYTGIFCHKFSLQFLFLTFFFLISSFCIVKRCRVFVSRIYLHANRLSVENGCNNFHIIRTNQTQLMPKWALRKCWTAKEKSGRFIDQPNFQWILIFNKE